MNEEYKRRAYQSLAKVFAWISISARSDVLLNFCFQTGKVSTLETINFRLESSKNRQIVD